MGIARPGDRLLESAPRAVTGNAIRLTPIEFMLLALEIAVAYRLLTDE